MNTERRKQLIKAQEALEKAKPFLDEAFNIIENAASEEREYYDNMPESLQSGEKGETASAAADALEEAKDKLEEIGAFMEELLDLISQAL